MSEALLLIVGSAFIGSVLGFGFGKVHENRRMNRIFENRRAEMQK